MSSSYIWWDLFRISKLDWLLCRNCSDFISNANGVLSGQRDYRLGHEIPPPPYNSQMVQDLGFHRAVNIAESFMNHSAHQLNLSKIKDELSDSFPKLAGVIRDPSTTEDYQFEEKLFRTLASECQINGLLPPSTDLLEAPSLVNFGSGRGNLSVVFPTANISNASPPLPTLPGSPGIDLHALDLLASARIGRSFCQPSPAGMGLLREDAPFGLGYLHESAQGPSHGHHEVRFPFASFFDIVNNNNKNDDNYYYHQNNIDR